jgi:hypothetical protein
MKRIVFVVVVALFAIIFFSGSCGADKPSWDGVKVSLPGDDILYTSISDADRTRWKNFAKYEVPNRERLEEIKVEIHRSVKSPVIFIKVIVIFKDGRRVSGSTMYRKNVIDETIWALKAALEMPMESPFALK